MALTGSAGSAGSPQWGAGLLADSEAYIDAFSQFVQASPTSYHAADSVALALSAAGFTELDESETWPKPDEKGAFARRDGAIIAWRAGAGVEARSAVRIVGSHTDSPGLMLKPKPDFSSQGWAQAGVEIYGGPLLATWFDRDLALAGRVVTKDASEHLVCTEPTARVPMLAIHLNREANTSPVMDRQRHMQPVLGMGEVSTAALLERAAGLESGQIAGADIRFVDTQAPTRLGTEGELIASPRLDNLSSVFASLVALLETETAPGTISMLAAFDHEELGSNSRSGAAGPMLEDVLNRLRSSLGATVEDAARAMNDSWCLSTDAGHAAHPNYAELHDPNVKPLAGGGPILKVNSNQRYASDAHGAALWQRCCEAANVASQVFVSNNTIPCGSTIGPLTATRLGVRTVDVGIPMLSMHSIRELAHVGDLHDLARVSSSFFAGA